jgi:hypothetical protein
MRHIYNRLTINELVRLWHLVITIFCPWVVVFALAVMQWNGVIGIWAVGDAAAISACINTFLGVLGGCLVWIGLTDTSWGREPSWIEGVRDRPTRRELTIEKLEQEIKELEWERDHA